MNGGSCGRLREALYTGRERWGGILSSEIRVTRATAQRGLALGLPGSAHEARCGVPLMIAARRREVECCRADVRWYVEERRHHISGGPRVAVRCPTSRQVQCRGSEVCVGRWGRCPSGGREVHAFSGHALLELYICNRWGCAVVRAVALAFSAKCARRVCERRQPMSPTGLQRVPPVFRARRRRPRPGAEASLPRAGVNVLPVQRGALQSLASRRAVRSFVTAREAGVAPSRLLSFAPPSSEWRVSRVRLPVELVQSFQPQFASRSIR